MTEDQYSKSELGRPEEYLSDKSWRHEEIAGAFKPAVWTEKKPWDFITYPKRDQGPQSTCTCYTLAKQLAVDELSENGVWRELSPRSLYPFVFVASGGGGGGGSASGSGNSGAGGAGGAGVVFVITYS